MMSNLKGFALSWDVQEQLRGCDPECPRMCARPSRHSILGKPGDILVAASGICDHGFADGCRPALLIITSCASLNFHADNGQWSREILGRLCTMVSA